MRYLRASSSGSPGAVANWIANFVSRRYWFVGRPAVSFASLPSPLRTPYPPADSPAYIKWQNPLKHNQKNLNQEFSHLRLGPYPGRRHHSFLRPSVGRPRLPSFSTRKKGKAGEVEVRTWVRRGAPAGRWLCGVFFGALSTGLLLPRFSSLALLAPLAPSSLRLFPHFRAAPKGLEQKGLSTW